MGATRRKFDEDFTGSTESGSAIGTVVERTTRYTMLGHLPGAHDAESVRDGISATWPAPGSAAPTKTPTGHCANTSPEAPT